MIRPKVANVKCMIWPKVKPTLKWRVKSRARVCFNLGLGTGTGVGYAGASSSSVWADGLPSALPVGFVAAFN
jgi:hypothetical protein